MILLFNYGLYKKCFFNKNGKICYISHEFKNVLYNIIYEKQKIQENSFFVEISMEEKGFVEKEEFDVIKNSLEQLRIFYTILKNSSN